MMMAEWEADRKKKEKKSRLQEEDGQEESRPRSGGKAKKPFTTRQTPTR
jgi:hypothetical protein